MCGARVGGKGETIVTRDVGEALGVLLFGTAVIFEVIAGRACLARAPASLNVALCCAKPVEANHKLAVGHVDALLCCIRRHQQGHRPPPKVRQRLVPP